MGVMTVERGGTLSDYKWVIPIDGIPGYYKADYVLPGFARMDVTFEITAKCAKPD